MTTSTSISSAVLLAYFQARTGQTAASNSSTAATSLSATAPIAPWKATSNTSATATTSSVNSLVASLLEGNPLVDAATTKLSTTTSSAAANSDYQNLFALYKGLTSLQTLATAAGASGVSSSELSQLQQAFSAGLGQVRTSISSGAFKEFQVSNGTVTTQEESTTGAQQESDTYTTQPLVSGTSSTVVPAFQGNVAFSLTSTSLAGKATTVNFDLSQMGDTPRSISNVISYLNSQLSAAGLTTRFGDSLIPGTAASTTTVDGVTSLVPATPDQYALQINGTPNEQLSFSAATTAPAVYIAATSTDPNATTASSSTATTTTSTTALPTLPSTSGTSTAAPTTTSQFISFDTADADSSTARSFTDDLPAGSTVTATATAPDGSVYVLANVTSTVNGQPIQGQQDAALLKYDSAGNLVYTRTLGAADTADATALAVSADGSQVAIAGSITGAALDPTDTSQNGSTTQQSFVTVFDSTGDELWSQNQDANEGSDNQVNAVAFGANNSVYVAGSTQGRLTGATAEGSQDAYIQGFSATSTTDPITQETTWTAAPTFTTEFGTSGVDRATGIAVEGSSLYVSSVQNGDAVVQQYALAAKGAPTLAAQQDLGNVDGGDLSGLAVAADGSIIVAGSTHNAALNAGTITSAYSGNGDAFVADLNANLSPTGAESVAYYNDGAPTTASALTVSGGQVYITGQLAAPTVTSGPLQGSTGYAAAIDPTTGQVSWSTTFTGDNGSSEPSSIAVSATGGSVLSQLGLPQGPLLQQQTPSSLVTSNSSVRAGDEFFVQNGSGPATAVVVAADDTYESLAEKISQASGFQASVTTVTINNQQEIKIAPGNAAAQIRLEAGPPGQDALSALGLQEGLVTTTANTTSSSTAATIKTANGQVAASNIKTHYSITVPADLTLDSSTDITATQNALSVAIAEVQSIYSDMTTPKASSTPGAGSGTVPAYITAQISNYTLALQRLTSGQSSSSSSSAALDLLAG